MVGIGIAVQCSVHHRLLLVNVFILVVSCSHSQACQSNGPIIYSMLQPVRDFCQAPRQTTKTIVMRWVCGSNVALASTLEEEPDNKDLQSTHSDNQTRLDQAKVYNSLLGAPHGAEVAVLARSEVLLVTGDGG